MSQQKPLRFSIVIPALNEARYIADTLDSLKEQDFGGRYEVIVVDNASTDDTAIIAERLGARVVKETRPGVCYARQKGTELAKGEIVISTDADTVFKKNWLTNMDKTFRTCDGCVAVAGPCKYTNGPLWGEIYPVFLFGFVYIVGKLTGRVVYITATNTAFKKGAWQGYNTELTQGGDELDLLRNLRKHGKVIFNLRNPSYTSARRLVRGLIYNIFVSFLTYYVLEYNLSRIFKHRFFGRAPTFRNEFSPKTLQFIQVFVVLAIVVLFSIYTRPGHYFVRISHNFIEKTSQDIRRKL